MSSDELRNRIAEVLMQQWPNTIFRRDAAQVTADAILALPEMQAMLAEDAEVERLRTRLQACQSNDDYPLTDDCITQNERFLLAEVERLRAEVKEKRVDVGELIAQIVRRDDEIVRLRAAGDALAKWLWRGGGDLADMIAAVAAWEEARREQ